MFHLPYGIVSAILGYLQIFDGIFNLIQIKKKKNLTVDICNLIYNLNHLPWNKSFVLSWKTTNFVISQSVT